MPRSKRKVIEDFSSEKTAPAPAMSPEARENQMISLAMNLAEKHLIDGTASAQEITHFLKLGTQKERLEKDILEKQKALLDAKTDSLKSSKRNEELYERAIAAMKICSGDDGEDDYGM